MPEIATPFRTAFDSFGVAWIDRIESSDLPRLDGGAVDRQLAAALTVDDVQSQWSIPTSLVPLAQAGLWLLAGDLDRSHRFSQSIESAEGSFWHGIMHRREGDFGNAKYWLGRVGDHPVIQTLVHSTLGSQLGYSDPFDFVDQCQKATISRDEDALERCMEIQWQEWMALMQYSIESPSSNGGTKMDR